MTEYHYLTLLVVSICGAIWGSQKIFFRIALLFLVLSPLSFLIGKICIGDIAINLADLGAFFMVLALFFIGLAGLIFIKYYLIDKRLN